jgi:hypothetical protein
MFITCLYLHRELVATESGGREKLAVCQKKENVVLRKQC